LNAGDPNVALVELVVAGLGSLSERFVFVGGCATGLLITDPARPPVRATTDVDLIVEITSIVSYYDLNTELRQIGFVEDSDLVCRWRLGTLKVDVMPTDGSIVGFANRWYVHAAQQADRTRLPSGAELRLISPPLFIATKLEAFNARGGGDYGGSHDMEDIVNVVDGRAELAEEISRCDQEVRDYVASEVDALLADSQFTETLSWHFTGDAPNQGRIPEVIRRLRVIAGI
jgi:predicted nucleotidyltransferase